MASIYRHRDGWQASVTVNGRNQKKNFTRQKDAKDWAAKTAVELQHAHAPHIGGPGKVTLGRLLHVYARMYSVGKRGISQELARINRYCNADRLPEWHLVRQPDGRTVLISAPIRPHNDEPLPSAFETHLHSRRAMRVATNEMRAQLAQRLVSKISRQDLRMFIAQMQNDGLSGSTIQKELALLKHALNMAIEEWNWTAFSNPLAGVRLPKAAPPRDRVLTAEMEAAFTAALADTRNPFVLPIFQFAIETTARRGSLLRLEWDDIDLDGRVAVLHRTKNGSNLPVPLTQRAVEILRNVPRVPGEARVFPISEDALNGAWDRACERSGLENFVFHDTRHTGTTRHARRLRSTHLLKQLTGHQSDAMLARYVHFMHNDVLSALDETEPTRRSPSSAQDGSADLAGAA